jgi:hypothetical protein
MSSYQIRSRTKLTPRLDGLTDTRTKRREQERSETKREKTNVEKEREKERRFTLKHPVGRRVQCDVSCRAGRRVQRTIYTYPTGSPMMNLCILPGVVLKGVVLP